MAVLISTFRNCQITHSNPKRGLVKKPILYFESNSRTKTDLIDLQSKTNNKNQFFFLKNERKKMLNLNQAMACWNINIQKYHIYEEKMYTIEWSYWKSQRPGNNFLRVAGHQWFKKCNCKMCDGSKYIKMCLQCIGNVMQFKIT